MINFKHELHRLLLEKRDPLQAWFESRSKGLKFPFYSSYDIRDAGFKVAPVDANLFPAGFNNICDNDKEYTAEKLKEYLEEAEPQVRRIGLLTENHTQNLFYWDNVATIRSLLLDAGFDVKVSLFDKSSASRTVTSASRGDVLVESFDEVNAWAQMWVSNNDFSSPNEEIVGSIKVKLVPSFEFGWHKRRKHRFFCHYNDLAKEIAKILGINPYRLTVETRRVENVDIDDLESRHRLQTAAMELVQNVNKGRDQLAIPSTEHIFLKNNRGTYGLGVLALESPNQIEALSYKQRKKMKAAKGGVEIDDLILQESIPTSFQEKEGGVSEPVIYAVGPHMVGGFFRSHEAKGVDESLNSPGMVFKKLCFANTEIQHLELEAENVYGWIAKLGALACALELKECERSSFSSHN